MAFDSTAELLFKINANSDDATGNIARFRNILSKDLSDMGADLGDWSKKVFGSLNSVQGIVTAGAATLAAAMVGVATVAIESAHKYEEYVEAVDRGSDKTGIAAEQMSVLKFAADRTGTSFDGLVGVINRLQTQVVAANSGNEQAASVFQRLGISVDKVKEGERNILPVLGAVMDGLRGLKSGTEQVAMARAIGGRAGAEYLEFLRQGSEGLRQMTERARELGLVITEQDIVAVKEHKIAIREMKMEAEAFAVAIGREVMPLLQAFTVMMIGLTETVKQGGLTSGNFFAMWMANATLASQKIKALVATMGAEGSRALAPERVKEATENWYGFSQILDQVKSKTAAAQGEEAKLAQEMAHLMGEVQKAGAEYAKLQKEGKLLSESAQREALAIAKLPQALLAMQAAIAKQWTDKQREELEQAHADLLARLEDQADQTTAVQERHWNDEILKLRLTYEKKKILTAENEKLIEDLQAAGIARIQRQSLVGYQQELTQLQQFLGQIVTARMTTAERLEYQYDVDLQKFSAAEEEKSLQLARSEAERQAISMQYGLNREAALQKYGQDLVALQNSQGWNGVFGSRFAQLLQHDEAALREWATSADQAFGMVQLRMVALEGLGKHAFDSLAQGMGTNIAQAIIYSKSVAQAMRAALAATLETIAAESLVQAIYATALGFLRLAQHNPVAATAAFTSAAYFGAIGGAAAVAGRLIAPKEAQAGAGGSGSSAGSGGGASSSGSASSAVAPAGPQIQIIVQGNIYRDTDALIDAINDGVERGKTLTATNTTTGKVVYR